MSETRGRRSETEPLEYHGEPLRRLKPVDLTGAVTALVFLEPGWAERFKELTPRVAPPSVEGEFSGELYPGAAERLLEATRNHPDYCSTCDGFPCQGNHPPGGGA